MIQENMCVRLHREIAADIYELMLQGDMALNITEPGQFVHVRTSGDSRSTAPLLRRPISISSADREKRTMTLIYKKVGMGTELLSETAAGETVDVLGPLGHGFPVSAAPAGGTALLIGGGVGVPPLFGLSQALSGRGVRVTHVLGFRSRQDVFYQQAFAALGRTIIMTEDGTAGRKGRVTDALDSLDFDIAYACGPTPMLKALETAITDTPLYLSLEQRMGCGIGACMACVRHTADPNDAKGYRRVCCDGPVFAAGEVIL